MEILNIVFIILAVSAIVTVGTEEEPEFELVPLDGIPGTSTETCILLDRNFAAEWYKHKEPTKLQVAKDKCDKYVLPDISKELKCPLTIEQMRNSCFLMCLFQEMGMYKDGAFILAEVQEVLKLNNKGVLNESYINGCNSEGKNIPCDSEKCMQAYNQLMCLMNPKVHLNFYYFVKGLICKMKDAASKN